MNERQREEVMKLIRQDKSNAVIMQWTGCSDSDLLHMRDAHKERRIRDLVWEGKDDYTIHRRLHCNLSEITAVRRAQTRNTRAQWTSGAAVLIMLIALLFLA